MNSSMNQTNFLVYPDEKVFPTDMASAQAPLTPEIMQELETFFHVKPKNMGISMVLEDRCKRIISRTVFEDNIYVSVSDKGEIIDIINFYVPKEDEKMPMFVDESDFIPKTTEEDAFTKELIAHMSEKLEGYELVVNNFIDRDYRHLIWLKRLSNGMNNPFQSVKIIVDIPHQRVASYVSYDKEPNAETAKITQAQAEEFVTSFMKKKEISGEIEEMKLGYCQPNDIWDEQITVEKDHVYLAYIATVCNGCLRIYVDALSGEIIGGEYFKAEDAGVFCIEDSLFTYAKEWAKNGFTRLGYRSSVTIINGKPNAYGETDAELIRDFWSGKNSYAFYFSGHGTSTTIRGNSGTWTLRIEDVATKDWHFVFLDACSTGASNKWATAFGITNNSGSRAWLGWYKDVTISAAKRFNQEFWPLVVYYSIRDAALKAADEVPGYETAPIRFYGDPIYCGNVWSN